MDALSLTFWCLLLALALFLVAVWHGLALVRAPIPGRRTWVLLTIALCFMIQQCWASFGWLLSTGIYDLGQGALSLALASLMLMVVKGLRRQYAEPPEG